MSPIQFTSLGTDSRGRDIVAFFLQLKIKVSVGEGLLDRLRSDPKFIETQRLPGERPVHQAA